MDSNGYCNQCPGECIWSVHYNQKYKWEYKEVVESKTVKELQEKYLEAKQARSPVQALIHKLRAEYDEVQAEVVRLMERSANCLNRLKEIALRPNPLSTPEYIDMLIEGEKSEAKSGWKQRVQYLIGMRQKAEYMAKVDRGEELLQSSTTGLDCFNPNQPNNSVNQDQTGPDSDVDQDQDQNEEPVDIPFDKSEEEDEENDSMIVSDWKDSDADSN